MSNPKNYVIKCGSGSYTINGNPATLTITPAEISEAIEKSDLSLEKQTIILTLISELTKIGITKLEEIVSKVYDALINDPDLFNTFIEIIKSIASSNN